MSKGEKYRLNKDYILKQLVSWTLRLTKLILKSVFFFLEKGSLQGQVQKKSVSKNSDSKYCVLCETQDFIENLAGDILLHW